MPHETIIQDEELAEAMDAAPEGSRLPSGVCQSVGGGAVLQAVDTSKLTATFTIVTNERNRHGNSHQITGTKRGGGLLTDTYQSNPVILFDHGLSGNPFPVAQSSAVRKTTRKATATATFPERLRDIYPGVQNADDLLRNSAAVFAGLSEGLIRMASIGFMPLKAMLRQQDGDDEQLAAGVEDLDDWRGLHFTESELQEWSIVTIGADRGALRQTLERGKIHDVRLPQFMRLGFAQQIEAGEPDPVTVPVGIAVASLEAKLDTLSEQVEQLAELQGGPNPQSPNPKPQLASAPQRKTITADEELTRQFLARTQDSAMTESSPGIEALSQAINQAVEPLAGAVTQIERDLRRAMGCVD